MKQLKKIPFFLLLALSVLLFSACALLGRKELYREYVQEENLFTTPLCASVFQGIYDGIMPWSCLDRFFYAGNAPDRESPVSASGYAGNSVYGDNSEQSVQENDADDQSAELIAAGNSSGQPHSGGSVSSDSLPDNQDDALSSGSDTETGAPPVPTVPDEDTSAEYGPDGLPLVHYMEVEASYFDDAVFIGDSRTRSLQLYSGLDNTTFLADTGLSIYTVLDKQLTPSDSSHKTTVREYLSEHQFKKVYLMLGVNELGTGTAETFGETYREVLETIQELQPDAIIYLQAILHISESKEAEGTYINNENIVERNAVLQGFADNTHIFWLDANPVVCDENGFLIEDYTFDGVHLQAKYVSIWVDWLKANAIEQKEDASPYESTD